MKKFKILLSAVILGSLSISSCNRIKSEQLVSPQATQSLADWESSLGSQIKLLGHRNWIVVTDMAYPLQSNPGITTLYSEDAYLETLQKVSSMIQAQKHIKAVTFMDKEVDYLTEEMAPGITELRNSLEKVIDPASANKLLHEDIIVLLDEAAAFFNIVIIKTDLNIAYTSVFFQLDCKYWDEAAEKELREQIK